MYNSESVYKQLWDHEREAINFVWGKSKGNDSELSFQDGLEFSRLVQEAEGVPGMCRDLIKHVVFGAGKVN